MLIENALKRAEVGTGTTIDYSGSWINDLYSKMTITQLEDKIIGVYESAVSGDGTKSVGDLQGYVDGDLISFVVHWRDFQAITTWVGQLEPSDRAKLKTLWQMVKQVSDGDEWSSVNAGADIFKRE